METSPPPPPPSSSTHDSSASAQALPPALRQRTVVFRPVSAEQTAEGSADTTDGEAPSLTLHLSLRCFVDYILLFVTEDDTCAPGVVLRYDTPAQGPAAFMYDGETPSLDVTVLLGMRDHPLTNMLASSIAHRVRRYGEARPLLMGLSVVQTAKQLRSGMSKKAFLHLVSSAVMELAGEGREGERQ